MPKKKLVVLTGAGISAESGIKTFRDADGLWENHRIEDVATPEAWRRNPKLVLEFYNQRRKQLLEVTPNEAHKTLVALEQYFEVQIITQNVDDLHERAGSTHVLHLHGELFKVCSTKEPSLIYEWKKDLQWGNTCDLGSQLRPHIVWFGEAVPAIEDAMHICHTADIFVVIGTSLQVYPAAGLIHDVPHKASKYIIDPNAAVLSASDNINFIVEKASTGTALLAKKLIANEQP
jgi:NAD-dependent deacetylase